MRTAWPARPLGKICDIQIGKTPTRSERRFWGGGNPWLSIKDMNQGRELWETAEGITDVAVEEQNCRLVEAGTVLLSFKLSIGKVGIAQRPMYTNEAIAQLPLTAADVDRDYLYWALRTVPLTGDVDRAAMGATLNKAKLKRIPIPVPPIEEQRRIAAVLDAADTLRAKRRDALAKLDTLAQAIFIDMFGGAGSARSAELAQVAEVQGGLQVSSRRKSNPLEVPYLRVANVFRGHIDLTDVKTMRVTPREMDRTVLQKDDLLVVEGHGNKDEIGRVGRWTGEIDPCVHQNHLIRVRCDVGVVLPRYVEGFMNSKVGRRALLRAANTTSGLNTISTSDVRSVRLPVPSLASQIEFANRLDRVDGGRVRAATGAARLDDLFTSLQQRAFRGDL